MALQYLSICSGIEAATVAWHPLGWQPAGFAEIDKFPSAVLAHHYPTVPNFGDFTKIKAADVGPIDLLVGGTPCQDFSVAGLRAGMAGDRGNLTLEFLRLADRMGPRWLVWENVPGVLSSNGGRDFGAVLGGLVELGYGFAYRVFDAQYFGLAQRRKRVFVVAYLGDWRRAAAVLFERESLRGDPAPSREAGQAVAGTLAGGARERGGYSADDIPLAGCIDASAGGVDENDAADGRLVAYGGNNTAGPIDVAAAVNAKGGSGRSDFESETFCVQVLAATLDANYGKLQGCSGQDANHGHSHLVPCAFRVTGNDGAYETGETLGALNTGTDQSAHVLLQRAAVRRLTPRECERLQGFPDDYTAIRFRGKPAADGPRYKAIGNSMAVPVMRWIGQNIEHVEREHPMRQSR